MTRSGKKKVILSNNHVLANENDAKAGDAILQPGKFDGGRKPANAIAALLKFVKLKVTSTNLFDCATAIPSDGIAFNEKKPGSFGLLKGLGSNMNVCPLAPVRRKLVYG